MHFNVHVHIKKTVLYKFVQFQAEITNKKVLFATWEIFDCFFMTINGYSWIYGNTGHETIWEKTIFIRH